MSSSASDSGEPSTASPNPSTRAAKAVQAVKKEDGSGTPAGAPPDKFKDAADRLRSAAKWLITTFGALGAALIGSVSISSLVGTPIEDSEQAVWGFSTAIAGCIVAIAAAAYTLANSEANINSLPRSMRRFAERQVQYTEGFGGLDNLIAMHVSASKDSDSAYLHKDGKRNREAEYVKRLTGARLNQLLGLTAYEQLRRRFILTVTGVSLGVIIAAIGALLFATGIPKQEAEPTAIAQSPAYASMEVLEASQQKYRDFLGTECDLNAVLVVVTAKGDDSYSVTASDPDDGCDLVSFETASDEVRLTSCALGISPTGTAAASASGLTTMIAQKDNSDEVCSVGDDPLGHTKVRYLGELSLAP